MRKFLSIIFVLILASNCTGAERFQRKTDDGREILSNFKLAGNCVFYENGKFVCAKKTLVISEGLIREAKPYSFGEEDVILLDDECVIFPGLADLHSHIDYDMMQLWDALRESNGVHCDNRQEWRASKSNDDDTIKPHAEIAKIWNDPIFGKKDSKITIGDVMLYFSELQAVCGGTVILQENSPRLVPKQNTSNVPESNTKFFIVRSTGDAEDFEQDRNILSVIDLYKPEEGTLDTDDTSTYLPHRDTSGWKIVRVSADARFGETIVKVTALDVLSEIIQGKSSEYKGLLIHLAEGRAGNIAYGEEWDSVDSYTRREFLSFKNFILSSEKKGSFTKEEVRKAHINLIHGCGINLNIDEDREFIRDYGIGVIWSPVSNLILYGDTPNFYDFLNDDSLLVSLGSDWSPSGSIHIWDECKFAEKFMKKYAKDKLGIRENILKAITVSAAKMIGCERAGNIKAGAFADFFILRGGKNLESALDIFFSSTDESVELVMLGGTPIYGDKDCISKFPCNKDSYSELETEEEELLNKRVYVPKLFRTEDFCKLYGEYLRIVKACGIELSHIRSQDSKKYRDVVEKLQSSYLGK